MKKILFFIFAALAFVACDKEKDEQIWSFPKISPTPVYSCLDNSGMIIEVKSDIPSKFTYATISKKREKSEVEEDIAKKLYETENEIYKITQIDDYTYQITIKPFIDHRQVAFIIASQEDPYARPGVVIIACGYEIDDYKKEYFGKYYSW